MFDSLAPLLQKQLRTKNAIPPLLALLIGYNFATPGQSRDTSLLLCALAIVLLMFYATLQNDLADYKLDAAANRDSPLVQKQLSGRRLKRLTNMFLALGVLAAATSRDPALFVAALVYATLIRSYNLPPVQGSHRPMLSIVLLGLILGALPVSWGYYIAGGRLALGIVPLLAGVFLYRCSISILKDYKDFDQDKAFGKRTFLLRYGAAWVRQVSITSAGLGYGLILVSLAQKAQGIPASLLVGALGAAAGFMVYKRVQLADGRQALAGNNAIFQQLFNWAIYFDAGVALCLYIS